MSSLVAAAALASSVVTILFSIINVVNYKSRVYATQAALCVLTGTLFFLSGNYMASSIWMFNSALSLVSSNLTTLGAAKIGG